MTHPRALPDDEAVKLERWYSEYECIKASLVSVTAKCRELGITKVTFYDTVRRVRGQDTKHVRRKLSEVTASTASLADLSALISRLASQSAAHAEPIPPVENQSATPNKR